MNRWLLLCCAVVVGWSWPARAAVRLPALVGSHMVLQRDKPLPLWGWADQGEAVTVTFRGKTYPARSGGPSGKWTVTLPATPAGGPYELVVRGRTTLRLTDVLVGDVWLASGQSNMEWPLREVLNYQQEIAQATYPQIRLFNVTNTVAFQPQAEAATSAGWQVCSPQTVGDFSAVAYFFGRDLHRRYKVPIGLISSEWGGTPAEAWMSAEALRPFPEFRATMGELAATAAPPDQVAARFAQKGRAWQAVLRGYDQGYQPAGPAWAAPAFDASTWAQMPLPGLWEETTPTLRDFDGVLWLRRDLTLPPAAAGQPLTLRLGPIDDNDSTYFNGVLVGHTAGYDQPRQYQVPARLVQAGRNVLTIRVFDQGWGGGVWGPPDGLQAEAGGTRLPLAGPWQYRVGFNLREVPPSPLPPVPQKAPTLLFNGMIAPLRPMALKGVIWYQGEDNAERAEQYRRLFPALIQDWRQQFREPNLPFLFVQLAGFQHDLLQPADYSWAELRDAQRAALALPHTGMATALDIGDANDIHPRNKQDVGARLALAARQVAYLEPQIVASGPTLVGHTVEQGRIRLRFGSLSGGLVLRDTAGAFLKSFAIAGPDRRFVWAKGRVEGNTLVVWSEQVPAPVAVRYAWGNSPFPNLYNQAGLPASPFRTDSWPGLTAGKK
ncbi:sialate O-acetylesterase [Hymenobacter weizhouensis]|uniref:sialate O-acetylesterase n=1 Tax=Hymenobacter sp. YIM 151500-1 TaxID=2987689 RepID=UPI0022277758|nr:sialate O-acetylesterase [Hymenobacter sp. YIM 151500-1]UYZ62100.1 sialate O-acetylesterase [Hymenobacter sp. YIM 151500-1]